MAPTRSTRSLTRAATTMAESALYDLLSWLSPGFPVGAFAHSNGLEWAIDAGWVTDRAALEAWLAILLEEGAGWNDAVLFTYAHRAVENEDRGALHAVAELAAAAHPSLERRIEALSQGAAFLRIARATAAAPALSLLDDWPESELAYCVAVGTLAAGHGIDLVAALTAYLHGFVANLVSAAQRLVPLGQTDGQRAIAALKPAVARTVRRAAALPDDDPFRALASATLRADLASMLHETQYTRLFRT